MLSLLLSSAMLAATASAACDRAYLNAASQAYVDAQRFGNPRGLTDYIISNVSYFENNMPTFLSNGVLRGSMHIDHSRSIHDTAQCATMTELIAASNPHPYVIHTRMIFGSNSTVGAQPKISLIESVVTDAGDWAFNATGYNYWNSIEDWSPPLPENANTRAIVKAAGDAYFDRFDNVNVSVPFGTPCDRLEGGAYTGARNLTAETCTIGGLPYDIKVTNRRYVVDEVMGVVDIFLGFPGLDRSVADQPMPDSHMFKIENGKIRYIHTVSACVNAGCGMNGTMIPQRQLNSTMGFNGTMARQRPANATVIPLRRRRQRFARFASFSNNTSA